MVIQVGGSVRTELKSPTGKHIVVAMDTVVVNELSNAQVEVNTEDDVTDSSGARPSSVFFELNNPARGKWTVFANGELIDVSAHAYLKNKRSCHAADNVSMASSATRTWSISVGIAADSCSVVLKRQ